MKVCSGRGRKEGRSEEENRGGVPPASSCEAPIFSAGCDRLTALSSSVSPPWIAQVPSLQQALMEEQRRPRGLSLPPSLSLPPLSPSLPSAPPSQATSPSPSGALTSSLQYVGFLSPFLCLGAEGEARAGRRRRAAWPGPYPRSGRAGSSPSRALSSRPSSLPHSERDFPFGSWQCEATGRESEVRRGQGGGLGEGQEHAALEGARLGVEEPRRDAARSTPFAPGKDWDEVGEREERVKAWGQKGQGEMSSLQKGNTEDPTKGK